MTVEELRSTLREPDEIEGRSFEVLAEIGRLHSANPDGFEVQELILRALEHADCFNGGQDALYSLVRERGLFPYLPADRLSLSDQIAFEFHRAPGLERQGIVFHGPQARVYRELMTGSSVILSAPTSFGKSLVIDAIVLSGRFQNILIIVPTIALIDETRRRLARLDSGYKVITHGSQEPSERTLYILTPERATERPSIEEVDFFVIDEFYKLSPSRGDDRAEILNQVFYKFAAARKQFYMLGPSIQQIPTQVEQRFDCKFFYEPYHTVVSELHRVDAGDRKLEKLSEIAASVEGPTLVYCSSPNRAAQAAQSLAEARSPTTNELLVEAASWMAEEYHEDWHVVSALNAGIGIHHGRVPRSLSQFSIRAFDEGHVDILVCTSSLIEGVNTKAKNVIIFDNKVSRKEFDYFTFNNIRGRSGRMFQHFVGNVYLFHEPPEERLPFVDIPAVTQSEEASDGLLLQIDPAELGESARRRVAPYSDQELLSIDTLKANSGVRPQAQLAIAEQIGNTVHDAAPLLQWSNYPSFTQLLYVCELMWEHCEGRKLGSGSALSAKSLAYRLRQIQRGDWTTSALILDQLSFLRGRDAEIHPDVAVQNVLDFLRLWPAFHFPRLLQAIDRIQHEVLPRYGYEPGDYTLYASKAENLFVNPLAVALEEYGLPLKIGIRLAEQFLDGIEELDDALDVLRSLEIRRLSLGGFERRILEDTIRSLA